MASSATTNTVRLVVYDLSGGMARQLGASLLGMQLDCLPHTGVVVFGQEYFFGGGIQRMPHEHVVAQFGMSPMRQEVLGKTERTQTELHAYLESLTPRFQQSTYDLFRNNCNHFSDEIAKFLLNGVGIPSEIIDLPNRVLSTPFGQMLAPMWTSMQQRMQDQMVPFNSAGTSPFGAMAASPAPLSRALASATSTISVTEPPKATLVEGLKGLTEECSPKELVVALETTGKILKNIINNPHEEKYRRLSLQNEKFNSSLGRYKYGVSCLIASGFVKEGNSVYMAADPTKWDRLVMSEKIVMTARKKAIRTFVQSSGATSVDQAFKFVDRQDPTVVEVVNAMFTPAAQ